MSFEDLEILADELPELFDQARANNSVFEESYVVPVHEVPTDFDGWLNERIQDGRTAALEDGFFIRTSDGDEQKTFDSSRKRRPPTDALGKIIRGTFPGKYRPPRTRISQTNIAPLTPDSFAF